MIRDDEMVQVERKDREGRERGGSEVGRERNGTEGKMEGREAKIESRIERGRGKEWKE